MSSHISRDDLHRDMRASDRLDQVNNLISHYMPSADRTVQRGLIHDHPERRGFVARRLAARDPATASTVFARLLKRKRGFSWNTDGEELLRQHKPSYFDGTLLPRTVVLSEPLSSALRRAQAQRQ